VRVYGLGFGIDCVGIEFRVEGFEGAEEALECRDYILFIGIKYAV